MSASDQHQTSGGSASQYGSYPYDSPGASGRREGSTFRSPLDTTPRGGSGGGAGISVGMLNTSVHTSRQAETSGPADDTISERGLAELQARLNSPTTTDRVSPSSHDQPRIGHFDIYELMFDKVRQSVVCGLLKWEKRSHFPHRGGRDGGNGWEKRSGGTISPKTPHDTSATADTSFTWPEGRKEVLLDAGALTKGFAFD
eukprot:CAMPEP_0205910230 /NCGR_PEP_ID=MMETSP1325-20131115/4322_1 /ASSEMBLY_ACC=CAM_ASM_000708 /TAXON_ID=236786 /ORGANISM="Florenciella sp., Strain RCC1007" /LENGTH=199 /DNA_ID=CAMNT_0053276571 /DNA_START=84 /DNA_END=681 /DNA_ORIENTATION=+